MNEPENEYPSAWYTFLRAIILGAASALGIALGLALWALMVFGGIVV